MLNSISVPAPGRLQMSSALELFHEAGFDSWQIGPAEGHHCHVDLARIDTST
jgi:hypothetical protein